MSDLDDELTRLRAELASAMQRFAPTYGVYQTAIDPLHFIRSDTPTDVIHTVHKPGLCIIVQGRKQIQLWDESYTYDQLNYLVVSVTLPLAGQVTEASPERPYFCIRLDIDPAEIAQLIADVSPIGVPSQPSLAASIWTGLIPHCLMPCCDWYVCWMCPPISRHWLRWPQGNILPVAQRPAGPAIT